VAHSALLSDSFSLSFSQAGKVRALGFSAHDETQALRLVATGEFDTVMFPLNFVSFRIGGVGARLLKAARQAGMAVFAIKAMARCRLEDHASTGSPLAAPTAVPGGLSHPHYKVWYQPETEAEWASKLLRFTLSLGGVCSAVSPGHLDLFAMMAALAQGKVLEAGELPPLSAEEEAQLEERCAGLTPIFHQGNHGPGNMRSNWPADR
jgi:aryl-alcohol dehydrogenase-like predicted oxidoreductase